MLVRGYFMKELFNKKVNQNKRFLLFLEHNKVKTK